ncbi:DNA topoisomerase 2-binding protein 1 [Episyrphus balteatus]|uniref:DNA topoisomerase 2-binding protein 1 n=1 Tax=Episyrphus balteatus TaxID=286459 RepID=UPI002485EB3A|nr:DNA topoisomerase 2-binding protein 1 [Episyrphus balteatus]
MSFDEAINAYFFIDETNDDEPAELSSAFATLKEHIKNDNHIKWIQSQEGFSLIRSGKLTRKDVFIFAKFDGELFEQLQTTKCLIVGPKCLINCLHKCEPIPSSSSPIFTTAMRGLHISASGLNAADKEKIRILVSWMGGSYFQNLGRSITHLLSNTIKSTKYEHATLNGIPVMHVEWVHNVWQKSCSTNSVSATDPEFDKYKLPVFYEVNITCSGIDSEKKAEIMRLVEENGGTYNRAFRSQYTDIVITERNKANSDKYQAAIKYKKDVLVPEWIFDSVTKGFALPTKNYKVTTMKASTPTKSDHSVSDYTQLSDVSRISVMNASKRMDLTVNDSICSTLNETGRSQGMAKAVLTKQANSVVPQYKSILAEICPKKSKKAGTFLDGCCIYLSGFRGEEKDKLNRILNAGGATRYDEINENLTHIIVGQLDEADFRAWRSQGLLSVVNIVRLDWLLESINQKQPASENIYRVSLPTNREPDAPSPSSKKTLRSMNHSFKQPDLPTRKRLFSGGASATPTTSEPPSSDNSSTLSKNEEDDLISQYSQDTPVVLMPPPLPMATPRLEDASSIRMPPPMSSSTQSSSVGVPPPAPAVSAPLTTDSEMSNGLTTLDYENLNFLQGMAVYIDPKHFDDEFHTQLVCECEAAHGNVVKANFRDPVDYAIVSFEKTLDVKKLPVKARNIVTELYVEECMKQNKLVPIEYFHRHIPNTADAGPLKGMTIVVSIYAGLERDFVDAVAQLLGASVNKTFVKREKPLLICPQPEGSKYEGAIKWQYPVVTSKWLLDCAEMGEKLPYNDYLVGDSPLDFPSSPALREKNSNELSRTLTPRVTQQAPVRMDTSESIENVAVPPAVAAPAPAANLNVTTEFTPLRNKRVTELAGPSRKSLGGDSPQTPTNCAGRPSCNFELMDEILAEIEDEDERECLREVILEMRNNQTPELERIRRQACTPINRKLPTPKGIPDFCTTPEFEQRMSEEIERRWRLPTKKLKPNTPIEEIRKRMLRATCKMIGIEYKGYTESPASTTPVVKPAAVAANETTTPLAGTLSRKKSSFQEKMDFEDCSTNNSAQTPELKQISEYLKNCESRRQSIQKPKKPQMFDNTEQDDGRVMRFESEQFGGGTEEMVTWKDPTEFSVSRRSKSASMQFVGTPRFSISCSSDSMRQEIIEKSQRLRGEISENLTNYDPECTHFLCERPNRGEKMLGCIASGKWVLGLAYIEECFAQNCFVNEELFEWGNPKAFNLPELTKEEQVIANAAHRWRKQLADSDEPNAGAFSGFHAILRISDRHKESLKNVIKAGHGKILQVESPYSSSDQVRHATHCFVDVKKAPLTPSDYAVLMEHGVKVLSQLYINAYLMNGKDADVGPYTLKI